MNRILDAIVLIIALAVFALAAMSGGCMVKKDPLNPKRDVIVTKCRLVRSASGEMRMVCYTPEQWEALNKKNKGDRK